MQKKHDGQSKRKCDKGWTMNKLQEDKAEASVPVGISPDM